jgi:hypothetical protein
VSDPEFIDRMHGAWDRFVGEVSDLLSKVQPGDVEPEPEPEPVEPAANIVDPNEPPSNIVEEATPGDSSVPTQTESFEPGEHPTESTSVGVTETTMPVADDPAATAAAEQAEANAHPSVSADNPPA